MGIFICCQTFIRILLDILAKIIFYIKNRKFVHQRLPPITDKILLEPAINIAAKIRSREITSRQVVEVFIHRIKNINHYLNAVVECRFEQALEEADAVDKYLRENHDVTDELEKSKPFYGVPFTVKETFAIKGMRHTAGMYIRKDHIADEDSLCTAMMKNAGGIVMGTTNVPEFALWWETSNYIYGTTVNSYSSNRSAGGSSGGEGSNISAAGCPMGIGSDMIGSIRIPAYFNGVFGHKASTGLTSVKGYFPVTPESLSKFVAACPISRYAADLRPLMKIITLPEKLHLTNYDRKINLKDIKIFYMESNGGHPMTTPVNTEVKEALLKTVEYFRKTHNIPCQKLDLPSIKRSMDIILYTILSDKNIPEVLKAMGSEEKEINVWWEIAKKCIGITGVHTTALLTTILGLKLLKPRLLPSSISTSITKACDDLKENLRCILGDNAVFLYPPSPTAALYHNESFFKSGNLSYCGIFNIIGLPVTQCPVGLNTSGLPLGVQVVGGLYQDDLCITVAEEIERAFGGWVSPSDIQLP